MKGASVVAGLVALAISGPALAEPPIALHGAVPPYVAAAPGLQPPAEVAQAQLPGYPPVIAPAPPPELRGEVPPPAPSASYIWQPGHWSWNGVQYFWQPGRYVERPAASANFVPGHWEHQPNGWVWLEGRWEYSGFGSSTPPIGYPPVR